LKGIGDGLVEALHDRIAGIEPALLVRRIDRAADPVDLALFLVTLARRSA